MHANQIAQPPCVRRRLEREYRVTDALAHLPRSAAFRVCASRSAPQRCLTLGHFRVVVLLSIYT